MVIEKIFALLKLLNTMVIDQHLIANWIVVAALAAPHLLYAYIWFFPQRWRNQLGGVFKDDSVQIFSSVAWLMKAMQFSSTLNWYVLNRPSGVDVLAIPPLALLAGLLLIAGGQALNLGIFNAIGTTGVYYGTKLGHDIPWVEGFPFNVVRHPQYVGSVMTVWGLAALVWSQAPSGLGLLSAYWTVLYMITGWMESCL